jgi:hypothetical protein
VTKKRHNLIEVVEPGPKALRKAEAIRDRFLAEVVRRRPELTVTGQLHLVSSRIKAVPPGRQHLG